MCEWGGATSNCSHARATHWFALLLSLPLSLALTHSLSPCAQATQREATHIHAHTRAMSESREQLQSIVLCSSHTTIVGKRSQWPALMLSHSLTCHPRCVGSVVFVVFVLPMLLWNLFLFVGVLHAALPSSSLPENLTNSF